jgi:hypothetical protein
MKGSREGDPEGYTMMSLLRTALLVSVALALLPTFAPRQDSTVPADVAATDAVNAASATFSDLSRLCERRPDACAAGSEFATAFGQRTREGAKILYNFVGNRLGKQDRAEGDERRESQDKRSPAVAANAEPAPPPAKPSSQHTLTAADMAPPWRGPQPRRDAGAKHAT